MRIKQEKNSDDFEKLTKIELYNLWFRKALTDKQIAKLYGVTKQQVKEKRKKYNIKYLNSAVLYLAGGKAYNEKIK